jgi:DNA (cytosine-5)-methyltransferase 1
MKRHIDLCAGLGTMSLALAKHGYNTIMACDASEQCREVYHANHGPVPWESDVHTIQQLPPCEVLTAGPPCQSFSCAGKREGMDCANGKVFLRVIELIRMAPSRPDVVIFENVVGLKTFKDGEPLRAIMDDMTSLGYRMREQVVHAEQWGSPALRSRIFIVGRRKDIFREKLPPFPSPPMIAGRVREHLEPSNAEPVVDVIIFGRNNWKISPKDTWFVGHCTNRATQHDNTLLASAHSQSSTIYHAHGVHPCFTKRFGPVFVPDDDKVEDVGHARHLTIRELSNMMGLPKTFKHHAHKTHAWMMIANGISMYALEPVVTWALGL